MRMLKLKAHQIGLALVISVFSFFARSEAQTLNLSYAVVNQTATSFQIEVMVSKPASVTDAIGLAALNTVFVYPSSGFTPTSVSWTESSTFSSLPNLVTGITAAQLKVRATQTPVPGGTTTVEVTTTPVLYGTMTVNFSAATYPANLTPASSGNPTVQGTIYRNGSSTSEAVALSNATIAVTPSPVVVSAPLPIDLVDFRARAVGATNHIEWVTASERNTAWHVVERSADGTGNWNQVGKVAGAGTTSEERSYRLEDKQPLAQSYYRLRSIDFDGQEERSNVVLVTRKHGIFGVTGAYPSPTADRVTVQFESLEEMPVTVQVFDFNGRLVMQQDVLADKGVNLSELDMTNLQAGTYTLHLVTTDAVSAQVKVVKQ